MAETTIPWDDIIEDVRTGPAAPPDSYNPTGPIPRPNTTPYDLRRQQGRIDTTVDTYLAENPPRAAGPRDTGRISGYVPPQAQQDSSFAQGLLALWRRNRELAETVDDINRLPGGVPGVGSAPLPGTFRYSPQATPTPNVPGAASPGTGLVRNPSGVAQLPQGAEYVDRGPSQPPTVQMKPELAGGIEALKQVPLTPGGQTFDFSDPSKLFLPGITGPQVPLNYGLHRISRPDPDASQRFAQGGGAASGFSSLGPEVTSRGQVYYGVPGSRPGHMVETPYAGAVSNYLSLPKQTQRYLRTYEPAQVPQHQLNQILGRAGITPEFVAQVRGMRQLGEI
ncbi:MAG: hypothetical protein ACYTGB_15430 [Planctomycetota bacterium]|jgi:hypothetical protein